MFSFRSALLAATAIAAFAASGVTAFADDNVTNTYQNGLRNEMTVEQTGNGNMAGRGSQYGVPNNSGSRLYQGQGPSNPITGNDNQMTVRQTGDFNRVGVEESGNTNGAYIGQLRNQNVLTIDQTTSTGGKFATNGNTILRISQNSGTAAQVPNNANGTNIMNVTQTNGAAGGFATHYIGQVGQTFSVRSAQPNTITIHQEGSQLASTARTGNRVNFLNQSGSANDTSIRQEGVGLGGRGAYNIVHQIQQSDNNQEASISQNGYNNYVGNISQNSGNNNSATLSITGNENGAAIGGGRGAFTAGRAAAAVGNVSDVTQRGSDNVVGLTIQGGNNNQFGFEQVGTGNHATDILISGNRNELAVFQNGTANKLLLSAIAGSDNIIGLDQTGTSNTASINVSGDRNVGFRDFTAGPAAILATSMRLAPGLLVQDGLNNQVSLTVNSGNANTFASLQDGDRNTISATQSGSFNQAAVAQLGNGNVANMTQIGSYNSMSISQR